MRDSGLGAETVVVSTGEKTQYLAAGGGRWANVDVLSSLMYYFLSALGSEDMSRERGWRRRP